QAGAFSVRHELNKPPASLTRAVLSRGHQTRPSQLYGHIRVHSHPETLSDLSGRLHRPRARPSFLRLRVLRPHLIVQQFQPLVVEGAVNSFYLVVIGKTRGITVCTHTHIRRVVRFLTQLVKPPRHRLMVVLGGQGAFDEHHRTKTRL